MTKKAARPAYPSVHLRSLRLAVVVLALLVTPVQAGGADPTVPHIGRHIFGRTPARIANPGTAGERHGSEAEPRHLQSRRTKIHVVHKSTLSIRGVER